MRMKSAVEYDPETSLDAMWCAFQIALSCRRGELTVGEALLNARYYDSSRGQFLSEDPVFLGNPAGQDLVDPQSLNTYSYSEDNPITKEDANGKQAIPIALGAGDLVAPEFAIPLTLVVMGVSTAMDYSLRNSDGMRFIPFNQQGREVVGPQPPSLFPEPGQGPDKPPSNKWLKLGVIGTTFVGGVSGFLEDLKSEAQQASGLRQTNQNGQINHSGITSASNATPQNVLPLVINQGATTYYRNYSGTLSLPSQMAQSTLPANIPNNGRQPVLNMGQPTIVQGH
jgi:RHS repeat-associated protein